VGRAGVGLRSGLGPGLGLGLGLGLGSGSGLVFQGVTYASL